MEMMLENLLRHDGILRGGDVLEEDPGVEGGWKSEGRFGGRARMSEGRRVVKSKVGGRDLTMEKMVVQRWSERFLILQLVM